MTDPGRLSEWSRIARVVLVLSVLFIAAGFASIARADGDPASDYLLASPVFLSSESGTLSASQRELVSVVRAANRDGFAIRVAVISSDYDLGSITALWRKPRLYARFLGLELGLTHKQRLLVVMPDGFGFNSPEQSTAATYRLLARVPLKPDGPALIGAAQTAVQRLAAAAGIDLAPIRPSRTVATAPSRPRGEDRVAIIAVAVAVLVAAIALLVVLLRRRTRLRREVATEPQAARDSAWPIRPSLAIPSVVVLLVVATGTPIVALSIFRHTGAASNAAEASVVTPPPLSWPAGRRPAPEFVLRDQRGRPVSPAAYHGRPVIVTFVDPLCRNLCPLEAKVLNAAVDQLPARLRPEILAVSVDVYANANARANLLRDVRQWELVPQWRWAVGRPTTLAAVWKRYRIGVSVTTKKIAGTTIKYITHSEAAYVIDATGHERALFLWPFYPQDVERTLRQLT